MPKKGFLCALSFVLWLAPVKGQDTSLSAQKVDSPMPLAPWVLHSKIVHETLPEYPQSARDHHIEGDAFVDVTVDANGKVQKATWVDCVNCSSILGDGAVGAVKQWEYQPIQLNGKPVAVSSWVAFHFRLDAEPQVAVLTRSESTSPTAEPIRAPGPRKLRVSSQVAEADLIRKINPLYPQDAREAHIQGDVVIQILIDREGKVANLHLVSGHPLLAAAAEDAVRQWTYKPFYLNGEAVEMETTVTVRFHLR